MNIFSTKFVRDFFYSSSSVMFLAELDASQWGGRTLQHFKLLIKGFGHANAHIRSLYWVSTLTVRLDWRNMQPQQPSHLLYFHKIFCLQPHNWGNVCVRRESPDFILQTTSARAAQSDTWKLDSLAEDIFEKCQLLLSLTLPGWRAQ